ncbi:hypothetical protein Hanom_Chr00s000001g01592341 [Helianthus anomalus]
MCNYYYITTRNLSFSNKLFRYNCVANSSLLHICNKTLMLEKTMLKTICYAFTTQSLTHLPQKYGVGIL